MRKKNNDRSEKKTRTGIELARLGLQAGLEAEAATDRLYSMYDTLK